MQFSTERRMCALKILRKVLRKIEMEYARMDCDTTVNHIATPLAEHTNIQDYKKQADQLHTPLLHIDSVIQCCCFMPGQHKFNGYIQPMDMEVYV